MQHRQRHFDSSLPLAPGLSLSGSLAGSGKNETVAFRGGNCRARALNATAILTGDHSICTSADLSRVKIALEGAGQISTPDPGLCRTSNLAATNECWASEAGDA